MNNFNIDDIFEQFYYKTPNGSRDECFKFIRKNRAIIEAAILNKVPEIEPLFENIKTMNDLKKNLKKYIPTELILGIIKKLGSKNNVNKLNIHEKDLFFRYFAMSRPELKLVVFNNLTEKEKKSLPKNIYHKEWKFDEHQMHYLKMNINFMEMSHPEFISFLFEEMKYFSKIKFIPISERKKEIKKYTLDIYLLEKYNNEVKGKKFWESNNFYYLVEGSKIFLHENNYKFYEEQLSYIYGKFLKETTKVFFRLKFLKMLFYYNLKIIYLEFILLDGSGPLFLNGIRISKDIDLLFLNNTESELVYSEFIENFFNSNTCFLDNHKFSTNKKIIRFKIGSVNYKLYIEEKNAIAFGFNTLFLNEEFIKRKNYKLSKKIVFDISIILYILSYSSLKFKSQLKNNNLDLYDILKKKYKNIKISKKELNKIIIYLKKNI